MYANKEIWEENTLMDTICQVGAFKSAGPKVLDTPPPKEKELKRTI